MQQSFAELIHDVIERAPVWLWQDFGAKDPQARARAEDAMAAMIAQAIAQASTADKPA